MSSRPELSAAPGTRPHFPSIILVLGEPTPGGLADHVREAVGHALGGAPDVAVLDLGDLRRAGLLERDGRVPRTGAVRRWLADQVLARLTTAGSDSPTGTPLLPCLVVCDGEHAVGRTLALTLPSILRSVVDVAAIPSELEPRIAMLVAWPTRWGLGERAPLAAWSCDLAWIARDRAQMDGVFVVARSPGMAPSPPLRIWSGDRQRDAVIGEQVLALVTTGMLDEAAAMRRGVSRSGLMAIETREHGTTGIADRSRRAPARERPIARVVVGHADLELREFGSDAGFPFPTAPRQADQSTIGSHGTAATSRITPEGRAVPKSDGDGLLVRHLVDLRIDDLPGVRQWMRAYQPLEQDVRVTLHRFADAVPGGDAPPPVTSEAIDQEELTP